jgi:schlafen family protein
MPHPVDGPYLEDILRFHVEGNSVDFKAVEYKKEQFPALLKDIPAMANSATNDDRYIIIGVKLHPDGTRSFDGISGEPTDSAIFQQLTHENIEPELM